MSFFLTHASSGSKILAAEKLRGCGAILLNMEGHRFVDELNRRDHVYGKLSEQTGSVLQCRDGIWSCLLLLQERRLGYCYLQQAVRSLMSARWASTWVVV